MNKSQILKLAKGLKNFTLDEISMMAEIEEVEIIDMLKELETEGLILSSGNEYQFIPRQSQTSRGLQLIEKPAFRQGQRTLFTDAAITFLSECNLSPSTIKGYRSQIFTNLIPYFGKKYIDKITTQDIRDFIELKQRNLSPKSISNAVTLLGTMMKKFYEDGLLAQNPYFGVKNSKVTNSRARRDLSAAEIEILFEKSKKYPQLHLMIKLRLKTGLKKSEILALQDGDIQNGKIIINKTFYEGRILPHKNPREVELPFTFKISELKNPNLAPVTFDNRLRMQFAEIVRAMGIFGFRFDDLHKEWIYD